MTAIAVGVYDGVGWVFADSQQMSGHLQYNMMPGDKVKEYDDALVATCGEVVSNMWAENWQSISPKSGTSYLAVDKNGVVHVMHAYSVPWAKTPMKFYVKGSGEDVICTLISIGYEEGKPIDDFLEDLKKRFDCASKHFAFIGGPCYTAKLELNA
jgi:hypothetical protein